MLSPKIFKKKWDYNKLKYYSLAHSTPVGVLLCYYHFF